MQYEIGVTMGADGNGAIVTTIAVLLLSHPAAVF
jgi:hypothetical protein